MRILNQRLSSGWSSWSGYVEEKKEHKAALARTLAGLSDKRMPAWRAWTQSVEEARAMRACPVGCDRLLPATGVEHMEHDSLGAGGRAC